MDLSSLKYAEGSKKKPKRVGRGQGSGHGKTSCRGHKGQMSRSGAKHRAWFEGGQMPLQRRVPKRGFTNIFRKVFEIVHVNDLEKISKNIINPENFYERGLIRRKRSLVKILGDGEVTKAIEVHAHAFSQSAIQKIEGAGGKAVRL